MIGKELLKQVISGQRASFLKKETGIKREALERVKQKIILPHIHVITGLRRCGKSTLLRQIVKEFYNDKDFYYLNFEDERLLNFDPTKFNLVYETMVELFGPQNTFFIDEIQHVSQFDSFIRRFYDQGFKFYLTGSNAGLLKEEISTRLTGRHIDTYLQPFSFTEYLSTKNVIINPSSIYQSEERAVIKNAFDEYLIRGGMPEYTLFQDEEIIRRNYDDIVMRDIILRKKVENVLAAKEIYLYLISNFAQRFSYNSLNKIVNSVSINTIRKYIGYLEESYFAMTVNRFDFSVGKQLANDKKIYICDNAFIMNISTRVGIDKGWLLENLIVNTLEPVNGIFYYSGKRECDFITMDNKKIGSAYQVCWELNEKNLKLETEGIVEALDHVGLKTGRILTYEQEDELIAGDKTITITPVWKWLLEGHS
ncbi:MAG: ATP-binding protein [Bacteroidota bacterium]